MCDINVLMWIYHSDNVNEEGVLLKSLENNVFNLSHYYLTYKEKEVHEQYALPNVDVFPEQEVELYSGRGGIGSRININGDTVTCIYLNSDVCIWVGRSSDNEHLFLSKRL